MTPAAGVELLARAFTHELGVGLARVAEEVDRLTRAILEAVRVQARLERRLLLQRPRGFRYYTRRHRRRGQAREKAGR